MFKINEIVLYASMHGDKAAAEHFDVKEDTVRRYRHKLNNAFKRRPKVLMLDIETSTMLVHIYRLGKQYINHKQIDKEWFVICWAAKWLYGGGVFSDCVTREEAIGRNDKRVVESVVKLLDEADIVVGHNLQKFDVRSINSRAIFHNIRKPSPYQVVDTLKQSRKSFNFVSHAQGYITKFLSLPEKFDTDLSLWVDCGNGNEDALVDMENYCKNDVCGLEELYLRLRPWMTSHPNMGLYVDDDLSWSACPNCGSLNTVLGSTPYRTPINEYRSHRCLSCGAVGRSTVNIESDLVKNGKVVSVAR